MGILNGLIHGDVADRDEGAYIGGTLTGVSAVMLTHVDEFGGFLHHTEGGLASLLRLTHEGDDSAVGGGTRVDVEKFDTFNLLDFSGHLVDDIHVASFADIGDALNQLFHNYIINL